MKPTEVDTPARPDSNLVDSVESVEVVGEGRVDFVVRLPNGDVVVYEVKTSPLADPAVMQRVRARRAS